MISLSLLQRSVKLLLPLVVSFVFALIIGSTIVSAADSPGLGEAQPGLSNTAAAGIWHAQEPVALGPPTAVSVGPTAASLSAPSAPGLTTSFDGLNIFNSGFIPPDPIAAAGPSHVVSVLNVNIQWRDKDGSNTTSQTLANFFASLAPANATFDPKVIYDQYADRFVVITLERVDANPNANPSPNNFSRILLAVSDTSDPNGTWSSQAISSTVSSGGLDYWADYPGLAIDEEAVYITSNMFAFPPSSGFLQGNRI